MKAILATLLLFLSTSCASIITGGTDDILVTSNPDGAYFRSNIGQSGWTPMTISVPDDMHLSLSFQLEGYENQSATVGTRYSAWIVGNIVFGGIIGLVVDFAAAGKVHSSDHVHVDMRPIAPGRVASVKREKPEYGETFEEWEARREANEAVDKVQPEP